MSAISELEAIEKKYLELENQLSNPEVYKDKKKYSEIAKAHANLGEIVKVYRDYKKVLKAIEENKELLKDPDEDIRELAKSELKELEIQLEHLKKQLKILLLPKDPMDERSVILELRAGTGGEEAALFAADLLRMYTRFAERKGWKVELIDAHQTGTGGFKEAILSISGDKVYSQLKYESGVHRVQRVPITESQGRIHTSAVTVAVLPEAEEVDIEIRPEDLRIDVFRASGPGGQHVNTTDSAVRITHLPTGLVVTCQDEKSQHKNKAKALKVLRARLLKMKQEEIKKEQDEMRRSQIGTGDRSERIRTYNFPQNRVTDHRINYTTYNLEGVLEGELDEIIGLLIEHFQAKALQNLSIDL